MNIHGHRTKQIYVRDARFSPLWVSAVTQLLYILTLLVDYPPPHLLFNNSLLSLPRKQSLLVHLGSCSASAPKILPPYICRCNLFYHFRRAVDYSVIWQTCTPSGLFSKEKKIGPVFSHLYDYHLGVKNKKTNRSKTHLAVKKSIIAALRAYPFLC